MQRKSTRNKIVDQRRAPLLTRAEPLSSYSSSEEGADEEQEEQQQQLIRKYKNLSWTRVFSLQMPYMHLDRTWKLLPDLQEMLQRDQESSSDSEQR